MNKLPIISMSKSCQTLQELILRPPHLSSQQSTLYFLEKVKHLHSSTMYTVADSTNSGHEEAYTEFSSPYFPLPILYAT